MTDSFEGVRAKAEAVDKVAQAVRSYLEQEQALIARARSQLAAATQRAAAEVRSRRTLLAKIRQEVGDLERALARCRQNCAGLSHALSVARRRQADAEQSLARAQQAAQKIEEANASVQAALRSHEPSFTEHGRAVIDACRQLATKLRNYLSGSHLLAAAEMAVTITGAAQGPLPKAMIDAPQAPISLVQIKEDHLEEQVQLWHARESRRLKEHGEDGVDRRD